MLDEVRSGVLSAETVDAFAAMQRPCRCPPGMEPVQLWVFLLVLPPRSLTIPDVDLPPSYGSRAAVLEANEGRLALLGGEAVEFLARDGGTLPESALRTKLLAEMLAEPAVTLKVGAPVMLLKTASAELGLVNGTQGVVEAFVDAAECDWNDEADRRPWDCTLPPSRRPRRGRWPLVRFFPANVPAVVALVLPHDFAVETPESVVLVKRTQVSLPPSHVVERARHFVDLLFRFPWRWRGRGRSTRPRARRFPTSRWTFDTSSPRVGLLRLRLAPSSASPPSPLLQARPTSPSPGRRPWTASRCATLTRTRWVSRSFGAGQSRPDLICITMHAGAAASQTELSSF